MAENISPTWQILKRSRITIATWSLPEATLKTDFLADSLVCCTFVTVNRTFPAAALSAALGPLGIGCWSACLLQHVYF